MSKIKLVFKRKNKKKISFKKKKLLKIILENEISNIVRKIKIKSDFKDWVTRKEKNLRIKWIDIELVIEIR